MLSGHQKSHGKATELTVGYVLGRGSLVCYFIKKELRKIYELNRKKMTEGNTKENICL
jgi:hypothetical protein